MDRNPKYYKQFICCALFGLVMQLCLESFKKKKIKEAKNKLFHLDKITKAEITEGNHDNTFNLASIRKTVNTLIATK